MNLRDEIIEYFTNNTKAIDIKKLAKRFSISMDDIDTLSDVLYSLESEGLIMGNSSNEYMHVPKDFYLTFGEVHHSVKDNYYIKLDGGVKIIIDDKHNQENLNEGDKVFVETRQSNKHKKQLLGTVIRVVRKPDVGRRNFLFKAILKKSNSNNYFYVELNGKKYYVPDEYVKGAYIGDEVTVEGKILDDSYVGVIKEIIKRKSHRHVFTISKTNDSTMLIPVGTVYYEVNPLFDLKEFDDGDELVIDIDDDLNATYVKTIENEGELDKKIRVLAYDNGIPVDFSQASLDEAKNISGIIDDEEIHNRFDLRNLLTVTMDSTTAKDLDDAISIEKLSDRYRLYVSIADVSHYVYPGTNLFETALERGTSIYPANSVIPMLPEKLSNGVCSLNEGEDKLTKTCIVDIDFEGKVLDHKVVNSIIRSDKKMSYSSVNKVLDGENVEGYTEYESLIKTFKELSDLLEDRRVDRGFISFVNDELLFEYDDDNNVCGIKSKDSGEAQLMIENFMLVANECVAELAFNLEVPFIYRNHDCPSISKIYQLKYKIKGFQRYLSSLSNAQNPKILQKIFLSICEGKSSYEVEYLSNMMLRSMSRAYYASDNIGHYGLALDVYATFTSPIRRLPDLLNHVILNYIIEGKFDLLDQFIDQYAKWAYTSTVKQMESENFEDNVDIMLIQKYADKFVGQVLKGRIVFVHESRIYVETEQGLYGYITLNHNNIKGNEIKIHGHKYKIGNTIDVIIDKCDEMNHQIIFKFYEPEEVLKKEKIRKK